MARHTTLDKLLASLTPREPKSKRKAVVRETTQLAYATRPISANLAKARMYQPGEPCPFCKAKGHISAAGDAELHPTRENIFRQRFLACGHSINVPATLRQA